MGDALAHHHLHHQVRHQDRPVPDHAVEIPRLQPRVREQLLRQWRRRHWAGREHQRPPLGRLRTGRAHNQSDADIAKYLVAIGMPTFWFTYIIMLAEIALLFFTWTLAFEVSRKYVAVIAKNYQAGLKLLWIAMASFFGLCFLLYTIGDMDWAGEWQSTPLGSVAIIDQQNPAAHASYIGRFFTSADTYMMLIYGAGYYLAYHFFEQEEETEVCTAV